MTLQNALQTCENAWTELLNLFYPNLCVYCQQRTHSIKEIFCLDCQLQIHPTGMILNSINEFILHFKGRIEIESGAALYYYTKGSRVQKALELLKYKNHPEIGIQMGRMFGRMSKEQLACAAIDLILPVPLHPKRRIQRGYNQSLLFAEGISEISEIPVMDDVLLRNKETDTQTVKSRIERMMNMQKVFTVKDSVNLDGKHILLVDDILTTGATLEACANVLRKHGEVRISMVTIAIAT
jgi:ComF family protein